MAAIRAEMTAAGEAVQAGRRSRGRGMQKVAVQKKQYSRESARRAQGHRVAEPDGPPRVGPLLQNSHTRASHFGARTRSGGAGGVHRRSAGRFRKCLPGMIPSWPL